MEARNALWVVLVSLSPASCVMTPPAELDAQGVEPLVVDADAVNEVWPGEPFQWGDPPEKLFSVRWQLGSGAPIDVPTHLFGGPVRLASFGSDGDRAGLAELFGPGEVGFAIRTRRPALRAFEAVDLPVVLASELVDLQDTAVSVVVGVEQEGRPSVVTLNMPQLYLEGGFGERDQAVILLRPVFPAAIEQSPELRRAFVDNLRTMALALNTVVEYEDGASLEALPARTWVAMMVRAVAGDPGGAEFFARSDHMLDDTTFVQLATTAALTVPLGESHVVPLLIETGLPPDVAARTWAAFTVALESLSARNRNPAALLVRPTLAPPELRPLAELVVDGSAGAPLAFPRMTAADVIDHFLFDELSRERLGEQIAPLQVAVLRNLWPSLLERTFHRWPGDPTPERMRYDAAFSMVLEVVERPYSGSDAFRAALAGPLSVMRTTPAAPDRIAQVPRASIHGVAQGFLPQGLLGLAVVAHALHPDLLTVPAPSGD